MKPYPKPTRYVNKDYLAYISKQPCLICGKTAEPHHWKSRGSGGSDLLCVPLCREHHGEVEQIGTSTFSIKYDISFKDYMIGLLCEYIKQLECL